MIRVAFDTETKLIGPGEVAPEIICATWAWRVDGGEIDTMIQGNGPEDHLEGRIYSMLEKALAGEIEIVTHGGEFDWTVVCSTFPSCIPLVFEALIQGRCIDTLWREKLLNLSTTGKLTMLQLPDGSSLPIRYNLAVLETKYLGIDRSALKDGDDIWRLCYTDLDGWNAEDYPDDAAEYALDDAKYTLMVSEAQDQREEEFECASMVTDSFQIAAAFALRLMTCWGLEVNPEQVAEMRKEVMGKIAEVEPALIEAGLLREGIPPEPHKRQLTKADALIEERAPGSTYGECQEWLEAEGIKFKKSQKPTMDEKALQAHVRALYHSLGEIPSYTGKTMKDAQGEEQERIKLDAEIQEYLAKHCETMAAYKGRKVYQKITTQQIPVLESGPVIYANYDVLKETGRTSSYGSAVGRPALYPAMNAQQVPNEIGDVDPRRCYRPREGRCFFDVDYTALELACTGQITYDLFGESVHLDRYNEGYDLHAYLGSQLVIQSGAKDQVAEFTQACREEGILDDPIAVYHAFVGLKKETEEWLKFYKHWRNFAKPVGLGFPGGLGPATMVDFARTTYGVILTEEMASDFREMWRVTYPEMVQYFKWLNTQIDHYNMDEEDTRYWYETPLGMIRRGASFCAAANGKVMQSPGAEGAKAAVIQVARECYDHTQESVLYGCRPAAFIHDQILGETSLDQNLWHEQTMRVRDIMCDSMKYVLPDINMRSDEAHLTSMWTKSSGPVFENERLIPWTPEHA